MFPSGEERLAVELKLLPGERRLEEAALVDEERDPDDHADREELWKDTHMTSTGGSGLVVERLRGFNAIAQH